MKKTLLCSLFLFAQFSFAQTDSLTYYYNKGDLKKAISYGEELIDYFRINKQDKNEGFVNTLSWLATLSETDNDTIKSNKYFKLLETNIDYYGDNYKYKIQNYYLIAKYYQTKKEYNLAEEYFTKAINLSELKNFEQEAYCYSLQLLGQIYTNPENTSFTFDNSKKIFDKQLLISEKLYTKNSYDYALAVNNLGLYYLKKEDFKKAEEYFNQSLLVIESLYGKNDDNYIASLDNLVKFYQTTNNLPKADFYNQLGLDLVTKKYGKEHKEYLNFISNKAYIKYTLGDLENSSKLYEKCISVATKFYNKDSSFYSALICNYANTLLAKKEYINAEKYYKEDYELMKKIYGENHYKTAMSLNSLSNIYFSLKQEQKAIEYNLRALSIIEKSLGKENSNYAIVCSVLGTQYALVNDFQNAEKYYLISYDIKLKLNGKYNISRIGNLKNLIDLYNKFDDVQKEEKYLLEYFDVFRFSLLEMKSNFSENELLNYLKKINPNNTYYTFLHDYPTQYPEINIGCFENQLLLKNLSLRNQERIKTTIEKSSDATIKEKHQHFIENKRYLTKLAEIPISERPKNYEAIKTDTENLEKELTRLSSTFADAKKSLSVNWKQVQEKLKPNEIAIDLVDYTYYNKKWTDSIYYGAFIIKKDSKFPQYITLFEKKQLASLIERNSKDDDTIQTQKLNKQYSDKAISDLFLKPLQNELKGVSGIYLSPSGLGHQINFSALPVSETQTLGDKYEIHILGSTAEMLTYTKANLNKKTNTELFLYGNIDYNKSDATNKVASDSLVTNNIAFTELFTRSTTTEEYGYLEGSKTEINKINTLAQQNNFASTIVEDRKATEESIKAFDGRTTPYVLHLATHGFFFPDIAKEIPNEIISPKTAKKSYYKIAEDPMMRSGLILAGANKNLKKLSEGDTIDDGILMASEISNLDLSACQLVVLSACETGLGQINGSEGVFGLQRAFKMAGVKNIIMSLWKVPDAQTAELFDVFYRESFAGKTIHEAFQTAQTKMKVKYPPYYWAGFVLLE